MFTHLRTTGQAFFTKLILFFLTGMFVLWGIGDVFRSVGAGSNVVATVGKTQISTAEFRFDLQRSHANPGQLLDSLINKALIENDENALGIAVNDDAVADYIRTMREFAGKDGQFDKNLYVTLLSHSGTNEARFVSDIRGEIASNLLVGTLSAGIQVPESTVQALYKLRQEQRAITLLAIPPSAVSSKVPAPTEQEIKAYYDAHAKQFAVPEMRTVSYIALSAADVQAKITVPEDEVKRAYDEHKDEFHQPERRVVEDLQFDNEEDAKAAVKQFADGKAVADVIATSPIINKDKAKLGTIAKDALPAEAAEPVFGLKENTWTAPVFSNVRWHIYHVSKIEPERAETLDEAHAAVAAGLASQQAQETLSKLVTGLEDTLAGGATLEQAAEKVGQKTHSIAPITREGNTADGKKADLPAYDNFLNVAFATQEKDHSQATQATDGSYFIVRVDTVAPEHVTPLADVMAQATKGASDEKIHVQLGKTAQDTANRLRSGMKLADALKQAGITATPAAAGLIKRTTDTAPAGPLEGKPLPHGLVGEVFRSAAGETTHAYPAIGGNYLIAVVTGITPAPEKADPEFLQRVRDELKSTLTDEVLQEYLNSLHAKYPVTKNTAAMGKGEETGE